ncbi:hypothetical protein [Sphingomonas adhaesiva]|uniref:hypothetical protein n=1 Tax=Sphingomonas adhaesiva TaxID=28212 RepID=UPI002FFA86ED
MVRATGPLRQHRGGKAADLVLLDRNPLTDIAATRAIRAVILRGKTYDRAALDAMLATVKAKVAAENQRLRGG